MIVNVTAVKVLPNYQLELQFDNGEKGMFDFKNYLNYKCYKALQDVEQFNKVRVSFGTLSWGENIDIAPECLYENSVRI